jgi:hypothetical protein
MMHLQTPEDIDLVEGQLMQVVLVALVHVSHEKWQAILD